jgi:hypothetical protein
MFGDRRRLLMSGGAIAVLVLAIWTMWPSTPAPSAASPVVAAQQGGQAAPPPVPPVKLDSLTPDRPGPSDTARNPFRYQPKAPPPRPVVSDAPPQPTISEPARPVVPPGPPPPPPIPLKFIGLLERANGVKWAVLSDGKNVMHGREGDIVEGRYRIVKIGTESIELTHVDGRGRQVVRLTGQ